MLGCNKEEIAVVENATRGWDMLFYAMHFKEGDRILTCTAENRSNYIAYLQVARSTGAVIETIPMTRKAGRRGRLADRIDERVKLIAVTHVPPTAAW